MVYNPFAGWLVTNDWAGHMSYSLGGTDYPLAYGTDLPAPGAGTLVNNGWVGSAGRRATLQLDTPAVRQIPKQAGEGDGDMVAVQFQHAASYMPNGHYAEGAIIGKFGASANGLDDGGDVHLHIHGLNASGQRVDFTKFIGGTTTPTPTRRKENMARPIRQGSPGNAYYNGWALIGELTYELNPANVTLANEWGRIWNGTSGAYDVVTAPEFHNAIAGVNSRRAMNGLAALPLPS